MKNLYIDFDGVILDTIDVTYKLIEDLKIDRNNHNEIASFYTNLDWKHLLEITPEINDSINSIKRLLETNLFDIAILTHVYSVSEIVEKVHFIRKFFPTITVIPVPKQISKTKMVSAKDSILIDDYDQNLKEWQEAGGLGILFSKKLKDKGFKVIDKLDQILEVL